MSQPDDIAAAERRFDELLAAHAGIVFRVVHTYCRRPEEREDLAQEIRLQLWRAYARYDTTRPFSTWMYRIALNTAISWQRAARARPAVSRLEPLDGVAARSLAAPATPASDEAEALYQAIDRLGPLDRALLLLHLDDLGHAEIGEVLGTTAANIAQRLSRLRQKLRRDLAPEPTGGPHAGRRG